MRPLLALLCVCVALGGCSLGDCSFETSRTTTNGGLIVADGAGAGDTLTVAFITDADPFIQLTVGAGVGINPPPTPDGAIEVLYDAVSVGLSGDRLPRPLAATPRNDTLFVYADGSLDEFSLHGGCDVLDPDEIKWSANFWLWNKPYQFNQKHRPAQTNTMKAQWL